MEEKEVMDFVKTESIKLHPSWTEDKNKRGLVVDMRGVNQFMKLIHFKMEGTPTFDEEQLCDLL
jgi:hypothetical protein